jgi:hypothetical protein
MLNFIALHSASRLEKGYHGIWEAKFATLATNVSAFINILAFISNWAWAKQQAKTKCSKLVPLFFGP